MKDAFGNEYVKPAACSHPGCPPWKCMQLDLSHMEPLPPESPYIRNMSPEERARIQREWDEHNRVLEAHRKKHNARRLVFSAALASLLGVGFFFMQPQDRLSGSPAGNAMTAIVMTFILTGILYVTALVLLGTPPAPAQATRRPSSPR